jgi:hypothetical protein
VGPATFSYASHTLDACWCEHAGLESNIEGPVGLMDISALAPDIGQASHGTQVHMGVGNVRRKDVLWGLPRVRTHNQNATMAAMWTAAR